MVHSVIENKKFVHEEKTFYLSKKLFKRTNVRKSKMFKEVFLLNVTEKRWTGCRIAGWLYKVVHIHWSVIKEYWKCSSMCVLLGKSVEISVEYYSEMERTKS